MRKPLFNPPRPRSPQWVTPASQISVSALVDEMLARQQPATLSGAQERSLRQLPAAFRVPRRQAAGGTVCSAARGSHAAGRPVAPRPPQAQQQPASTAAPSSSASLAQRLAAAVASSLIVLAAGPVGGGALLAPLPAVAAAAPEQRQQQVEAGAAARAAACPVIGDVANIFTGSSDENGAPEPFTLYGERCAAAACRLHAAT